LVLEQLAVVVGYAQAAVQILLIQQQAQDMVD
jgi:hypothetical protein